MVTKSEVPAFGSAARTCSSNGDRRVLLDAIRLRVRRGDDLEFEVVWSGVGPLPGAGGAAGLGSTLSGTHFSIGKRG